MSEEKLAQSIDTLSSFSVSEKINLLAHSATVKNYAFAIFRMPNTAEIRFMAGKSVHKIDHEDLNSLKRGFLISDFEGLHSYFDEEVSYSTSNGSVKLESILPTDISKQVEPWLPYTSTKPNQATNKDAFLAAVKNCIAEIKSSELLKVVPSRTKTVSLDTESLPELFVKLCDAYPRAFVSITSTPDLGTWVGATPETLIEVNDRGIFKTMSLAGTQKYNGEPLHTLPWTQKEIEEQAMVSRYIINRFKEIRLREFVEVGPRTVSAGNMAHLCSIFTVDTVATDFQDLASVMLKLLHPTSAVCGMPKQHAKKLIDQFEAHDRKLFSGYLGPVNINEGSYIYVNLRCMEIQEGYAVLYAGAGVTAYSNPEDEWNETELKCNTLLNIIGN